MFKQFYYVLFGGSDLERAMFFLDAEKKGVNRYLNKIINIFLKFLYLILIRSHTYTHYSE